MESFANPNTNMESIYSSPSYPSYPTLETLPSSSSSSSPSFLGSLDWKMWIFIVFVLAFLGLNIFIYLAEGTQLITNISAEGAKAGVNIVAGTVDKGLDVVQKATTQQEQQNPTQQLNDALNDATNKPPEPIPGDAPTYQADDSYSSIQSSKTAGKSGWCYIGEDRGFRSCIQVGENDQCMSGDIFPSQDICVNPNLRA
jgi:hypothetical protein